MAYPVATKRQVLAACEHLRAVDPSFIEIIDQAGPISLPPSKTDHFAYLVRSVVHQQLAGAAARTIHGRLAVLAGGEMRPEVLLGIDELTMRSAGISGNKYLAITDLAQHAVDGKLAITDQDLRRQSNEQIIEALSSVRGIGPWTAQMFLMHQLRRLDVWPTGDLGVRNGFGLIHRSPMPTPKELELQGVLLRPYRTVAAVYCWRAVDLAREKRVERL